ncbi:MAG: hypothetical protein ABS882_09110 [Lysinibacillus sp.]
MNVTQLNAQLQRLPTNWLVKMSKDYGIQISAAEIDSIKLKLQQNVTSGATLEDISHILLETLGKDRTRKLLELLQFFL